MKRRDYEKVSFNEVVRRINHERHGGLVELTEPCYISEVYTGIGKRVGSSFYLQLMRDSNPHLVEAHLSSREAEGIIGSILRMEKGKSFRSRGIIIKGIIGALVEIHEITSASKNEVPFEPIKSTG